MVLQVPVGLAGGSESKNLYSTRAPNQVANETPSETSSETKQVTILEKYTYLKALADRVESTLLLNKANLSIAKNCYTNSPIDVEACRNIKQFHAENLQIAFPVYHQNIFNLTMLRNLRPLLDGYKKQASQDVEPGSAEFRPKVIKLTVAQDNPLRKVTGISRIPEYKYSTQDIQRLLVDESLPLIQQTNEGPKELPYAYNINGILKLMCDQFHDWSRSHARDFYPFKNIERNPVCSKLNLVYDSWNGGIIFPNGHFDSKDEKTFFNDLYFWILNRSDYGEYRVWLENLTERFMRLASETPWIALVDSATPPDQELFEIFSFMEKNAAEEAKDISKKRQKLDDRNPDVDSMLYLLGYSDIASDIIDEPSYEMGLFPNTNWESVAESMYGSFQKQGTVKLVKTFAFMLGGALVCYIPVGWTVRSGIKLFKMIRYGREAVKVERALVRGEKGYLALRRRNAMLNGHIGIVAARRGLDRLITEVTCTYGFLGVGANLYFYKEAQDYYAEVSRRVFSTLEGSALLGEIRELPDAESGLLFEILMLPVGTFSIKGAGRILGKLTPRSRNHFIQAAKDLAPIK